MNNLPANKHVNIRLFADDCIISNVINTHEGHIDYALQTVIKWCSEWQMTLIARKSTLLIFSRKKNKSLFPYKINDMVLSVNNEHKYLGLAISEDLRWIHHINHITVTTLQRHFCHLSPLRLAFIDTKLLAYNAFMGPILEYANVAWFLFPERLST